MCEGKVTEPAYLKAFSEEAQNSLVHVETVGSGGDPLQIVESAVELRNRAKRAAKKEGPTALYEEVWAVFDRDQHNRYDEGCRLAKREGIKLAVSNPCFELWLLLHFTHQGGHISCKKTQEALELELPNYSKDPPFEKLESAYATAVKRARQIRRERKRAGEPGGNPSTTVDRLTERVRKLGRDFQIEMRKKERKQAGL